MLSTRCESPPPAIFDVMVAPVVVWYEARPVRRMEPVAPHDPTGLIAR